ncbi:MAG: hypothetical protein WD845_05195 [Pirellulales bacterium]
MTDDAYSRQLLQEAYEDGCRRCAADLQQFVTPLEAWMDRLLEEPLAPDWRDQLNDYLAEQEPKGYRIEPENRWVLEAEILDSAAQRVWAAGKTSKETGPSSPAVQMAQEDAARDKAEQQQEREFRWFAREASALERKRLGLSDGERAEYERYLIEAQRSLARGEPAVPAPDFYLEKKARYDEQQAEADRNTPTIRASRLSDLEWEIQTIVAKLSHRALLSDAEYQSLVAKLRLKQRELYYQTGDWNFVTRTMDRLLNPAWDGTGTLNDIAIGLGGFSGGAPGLSNSAGKQPLASPPRRGRRPARKPGRSPSDSQHRPNDRAGSSPPSATQPSTTRPAETSTSRTPPQSSVTASEALSIAARIAELKAKLPKTVAERLDSLAPSKRKALMSKAIAAKTDDEALDIIEQGLKAGIAADDKVNSAYRSVESNKVNYVGITNNIARRAIEQLRSRGIIIEKILDKLSRSDARAVEQALIKIHGLQRSGGTLENRINSIAKSNPKYAHQLKRGFELLQSIGYR